MQHGMNPGVAGSELSRLLARLADGPAADARPVLAQRLADWLGWTGALALSSALTPGAATPAASARGDAQAPQRSQAATRDLERVRASLLATIDAGPTDPPESPTDLAPLRRHAVACQATMHEATAALRARLRRALGQASVAGQRLAAIDEALERAVAPQERALLGLLPARLMQHLAQGPVPVPAGTRAAGHGPQDSRTSPVAHHHRRTVQDWLRAELDHRLLPCTGLLAALSETTTP